MFISALGSITGIENRIGLPRVKSACVIMVDGLGSENLKARSGHAPMLSKKLNQDGSILCGFPTTTATSLSSFSTGLSGGSHGMVGYEIFDRANNANVNLLTGFASIEQAKSYQSQTTVSQLAAAAGVDCYFIGSPDFQNSGYTHATMPNAIYVPAKGMDERFEAAKRILSGSAGALVYLYIPELDSKAHAFGVSSNEWLQQLELLDSLVSKFVPELSKQVGVALTADHGVVDVASERQVYLDEWDFGDSLVAVAGDPRVNFLYFDEAPSSAELDALQAWLGKRAIVSTKREVVDSGWYGEVSDAASDRMPDVFVIANGETAIYHRKFAKPHSLKMIGQHGAISNQELSVPFLKFGGYNK